MRKELKIEVEDSESFKLKSLLYGNRFNRCVFLDSSNFCQNHYSKFTYYEYDFLVGFDSLLEISGTEKNSFKNLSEFNNKNRDWMFGYLTYDLKNDIENLRSENIDELNFASFHFFIPQIILVSKDKKLSILFHKDQYSEKEIYQLISEIDAIELSNSINHVSPIILNQRFTKKEYINTVNKLKKHIQLGDIYEVNFCQEFYSHKEIDPVNSYLKLKEVSPTPFSCYYKYNNNYLLSASPERFLKKNTNKIISQPIKGTIKRSENKNEDLLLKEQLLNDPKERAENVMIVDLVRNDLSKTAKKGSVKVEELYGIYSFKQVHQMISTIVSDVENDADIIEIIKNAFPMGSMTGAPKIRAMKLIEEYEKTKRGLYSGCVGFITPEKNFDFNVVIRSILYNQKKKYVSFTVGGAITSLANANKEYEECMLKAEAMLKVLQ